MTRLLPVFLLLDVGSFFGFAILVWDGKEVDSTENPLHTLRVQQFNLGHVCGKDCDLWISLVILFQVKRRRCDQDHEGFMG